MVPYLTGESSEMYVGYGTFLIGNPKKNYPKRGVVYHIQFWKLRRSHSASSNVVTIHLRVHILFLLFLLTLSEFSGCNENPNTRKKNKQKTNIGNEHHVVGFTVMFVFFRFPRYFARFLGLSSQLFSKSRSYFILITLILYLTRHKSTATCIFLRVSFYGTALTFITFWCLGQSIHRYRERF